MRAGPLALVAALLCAGCTAGDRTDFGAPAPPLPTTSVPPPTTSAAPSTTTVVRPDAGTVTLRVTGLSLPAVGTGGSGVRLLVRAASSRLIVRRTGGAGAVTACPVAAATGPADAGGCVDLGRQAAVTIAFIGGVEVRATGAEATVDELAVNYLPAARSTTLVTPARPSGACGPAPCQATYSLVPGGAGAFVLDGQGSGGRPRLVLTATAPTGSAVSNRTLATVEGGGFLSIRATLEAGSEARLLHHEQGPDATSPLTAEILWP